MPLINVIEAFKETYPNVHALIKKMTNLPFLVTQFEEAGSIRDEN